MFDLITQTIASLGAFGIAVLMFIENIFPPVPSELILPLAGFLMADGQLNPFGVILAALIGTVGGAMLWYWAGRKLGRERVLRLVDSYGRWLTVSRSEVERAFDWFERHEGRSVFLARLVPGLRTVISVPAGLAGMPVCRFLLLTTAGSLIWTLVLLGSGYILKANYAAVADVMNLVVNAMLAGIAALYVWRLVRWKA